jgi:signal transduction histidine kinase
VAERSEQLSKAYEDLKAQQAHLRQVSGQAIMLQERERRAIARELHDAVGQALTAVRINLQLIGPEGAKRQDAARIAVETVTLVDEALEEVRRAVSSLGPAIVDEIGLEAAVERQCADFADRTGIEVETKIELPAGKLPPAVESTCYRVVQEGLTNVVKHASAQGVTVRLQMAADEVLLQIGDDGQGMAPEAEGETGRGLAGIRERILLLGGDVQVDSSLGQGTTLRVRLPVRAAGTKMDLELPAS